MIYPYQWQPPTVDPHWNETARNRKRKHATNYCKTGKPRDTITPEAACFWMRKWRRA